MPNARIYIPNKEIDIFQNINKHHHTLVIGQVQSGKTSFILETSFNALNYKGYDLVIIFGGTNNILLSQTRDRIVRENRNHDNILHIESNNTKISTIEKGRKYIINCLKENYHIGWLKNFLKFNTNCNSLIIDDESDFASINCSSNSGKIFEDLKGIFHSFEKSLMLSVTATPFADITLKNSWNFDNIHFLKAPKEYTGIDFFIDNKNELFVTSKLSNKIDLKDYKFWINVLFDHFFRVNKSNSNESQLLVNCHIETQQHEEIYDVILKAIGYIYNNPNLNSKRWIELYKINDNDLKNIKNLIFDIYHYKNLFILNKEKNEKNMPVIEKKHSIIIGGQMLSRGKTFEKLFSLILYNEPKELHSADTLLQKCRMFGYRNNIDHENNLVLSKFMKIYCSDKTLLALCECQILNKILFDNICISQKELKVKLLENNYNYIFLTGKK